MSVEYLIIGVYIVLIIASYAALTATFKWAVAGDTELRSIPLPSPVRMGIFAIAVVFPAVLMILANTIYGALK